MIGTLGTRPALAVWFGLAAALAACSAAPKSSDEAADLGLAGGGTLADEGPSEDAAAADLGPAVGPAPDADTRGPRLNSLIPNRGPLAGGTVIRIVGTGLLEGTVVHIGERECLGVTYVSDTHLDCTTPQGFAEGPVSVTLRWSSGGSPSRVEEAFTYFVPVEVSALTPDRGPVRGGTEVTIDGTGLVEPTDVRVGGTLANVTREDDHRLHIVVPEGLPGPADVIVRNVNGEVRLPGAYTYFEPLLVSGLTPRWGYTRGGTEVDIAGTGLVAESEVRFGDAPGTVRESRLGRTHLTVLTPPAEPGLRPVTLENVNGSWRSEDAFLYVNDDDAGFSLVGVAPSRVAAAGGEPFDVGGAGFTAATVVAVDGQTVECALENPHILHCVAPEHAVGPVDVTVTEAGETLTLPGGLTYYSRVDIYRLRPARGAVAGGTFVEVSGEGFTENMTLTLDGSPFTVVEFVDEGTVWAVSPPGRPGLVTAGAATPDDAVLLPEAYEYFDPVSRFGGVFGEPIAGAVNVTVLDAYTGEPIVGATAMAEPEGDGGGELLTGTTDAQGQVVLSGKIVLPTQRVTAAAPDYEVTTVDHVGVENVTVYLFPHHPPSGGGGGGGGPIPNCVVSGEISGLGLLEKPIEGVLVALVDTTHASPFNRMTNLPAEPNGVLTEDGPFEVVVKPGEMAIIVTAGIVSRHDYDAYRGGRLDYWALHDALTPIAMGVQRFISLSPGQDIDGLEIAIDRPMDVEIPAVQVNPPIGGPDAPYNYEAWALLDFGAEGYWELDVHGFGATPDLMMAHLPDIRGWDADIQYLWMFWGHPGDRFRIAPPYTLTSLEMRDITAGVRAEPVASLAVIDTPADDTPLGVERTIRWHWADGTTGEPTAPPEATVLTIDSPEGLALWTYVVPGDQTEAVLPVLPADVMPGGLVDDQMRLTVVPFVSEAGLNYGDFTYDDLSYYARRSYSVSTRIFRP